jgi:hypothetical protein
MLSFSSTTTVAPQSAAGPAGAVVQRQGKKRVLGGFQFPDASVAKSCAVCKFTRMQREM